MRLGVEMSKLNTDAWADLYTDLVNAFNVKKALTTKYSETLNKTLPTIMFSIEEHVLYFQHSEEAKDIIIWHKAAGSTQSCTTLPSSNPFYPRLLEAMQAHIQTFSGVHLIDDIRKKFSLNENISLPKFPVTKAPSEEETNAYLMSIQCPC